MHSIISFHYSVFAAVMQKKHPEECFSVLFLDGLWRAVGPWTCRDTGRGARVYHPPESGALSLQWRPDPLCVHSSIRLTFLLPARLLCACMSCKSKHLIAVMAGGSCGSPRGGSLWDKAGGGRGGMTQLQVNKENVGRRFREDLLKG